MHFCQGLKRHHILRQEELDTSDLSLVFVIFDYSFFGKISKIKCFMIVMIECSIDINISLFSDIYMPYKCLYLCHFFSYFSFFTCNLFSKIVGWEGQFNQLNSPSTSFMLLCVTEMFFLPHFICWYAVVC